MNHYTTFIDGCLRRTTLLTAAIVGFEQPDPRVGQSLVVLESGATVDLRIPINEAISMYEEQLKAKGESE